MALPRMQAKGGSAADFTNTHRTQHAVSGAAGECHMTFSLAGKADGRITSSFYFLPEAAAGIIYYGGAVPVSTAT